MNAIHRIRTAAAFVAGLAAVAGVSAPALAAPYTLTVRNKTPNSYAVRSGMLECMESVPSGRVGPHSTVTFHMETHIGGHCANAFHASMFALYLDGEHPAVVRFFKRTAFQWRLEISDAKHVHGSGSLHGADLTLLP